jgi:hypothetical protein
LSPEAARRVRFIRDLYSATYAHLPADVICCRHTLEHIQPTAEFLQMLRRVIGARDTLVFLEVPDLTRVLRERAFWDMYYEHCSYFTTGSLARLFRSSGFDILELTRDFGDQYLWVMARPTDGPTTAALPLEDDLTTTRAEVAAFKRQVPGDIAGWRERIRALAAAGRKPVLWGAGSKAVAILTSCRIGSEVGCLVDVNPHKVGKFLPGTGHPVVSPLALRDYRPGVVVAMNPVYVDEIRQQLLSLGVDAEVIAV